MRFEEVTGKKQFTAVMEYDISFEKSEEPLTVKYKCKPNKKTRRRLMKGVKLTKRYLTKMEKYGYKIENVRFEREEEK
jgi:hypothetical protein